jgi:hypothetical protein
VLSLFVAETALQPPRYLPMAPQAIALSYLNNFAEDLQMHLGRVSNARKQVEMTHRSRSSSRYANDRD